MTEIYCSKCGEKNSPTKDYCIKCGSILRKLDNFKVGDKITSFEDMFTQKHKEQLNEIVTTLGLEKRIKYMKQVKNPLKTKDPQL